MTGPRAFIEKSDEITSPDMRRLKLLLIAGGCDNTDVGEVWVAFQWVSQLARRHDVTLLTYRLRARSSAIDQLPGVAVVEWLDLPLAARFERFNSLLKPGYVSFYIRARRWIKKQLRRGERFDLAHQITPVAMRYPSPAAGLGIPLIVGPLAGSLDDPAGFEHELSTSPWYTKLRALDEWRLRHDPLLRGTYAGAQVIMGVAPYVADVLGQLPVRPVEFMSEIGVSQLPARSASSDSPRMEKRLLFVGRVIRTKGVRDAIRAMAMLKDVAGLTFDVVGDGNDLAACKAEAVRLGVGGQVNFHGRLPRKDIEPFYRAADIFLFPSFREPSGIVVIEAMSHGLAMVVADRGGPGYVVDDVSGIRVPVGSPPEYAANLAYAIRRLVGNPELTTKMGMSAREKIRSEFLWDAKIRKIEEIYERATEQAGRRSAV